MREFFCENRKKVFEFLNNGEAAIFFCGEPMHKVGDEYYPFTPNRNFYYLTGLSESRLILVVYKAQDDVCEKLFLKRPDPDKEKWTGAVLRADEAENLSGIADYCYIDEFEEFISEIILKSNIKRFYFDLEKQSPRDISPALRFADKLRKSYPYMAICDISSFLVGLRAVKSDFEVANIKKAINITKKGIYSMMKNARPNMFEYELEAYFDFELKRAGVFDKAFASIIAGGVNGTILHYSANNSPLADGSLALCDVGAAYGFYSGDITRTFPVNGKFTARQRDIYNIVLEGNLLIQDEIRIGLPFKSLNEKLIEYYAAELKKIGLIKLKEDVRKYYWHGVSHLLGLETHDAGRGSEGDLREGMVFTVEPGLYIADEGIGIRIEDDVMVTKNKCLNLSSDIIKTPQDIEEFMK